MAPSRFGPGLQLRSDFDLICDEVLDLVDLVEQGDIDFNNGMTVSDQHAQKLRLSYEASAGDGFWKFYAEDARLDETLEGYEELIDEYEGATQIDETLEGYEERIEKCEGATQIDIKTMEDAYIFSLRYNKFLYFIIARAALYNPVFQDGPDGLSGFEEIARGQIWPALHLETHLMFGMRGRPHVTILSVQPQQASTNELTYPEFYTLFYWAVEMKSRVRYNHDKCFPIRLVSLCGRRARVISAVFSSGYMRCVGTRSADPKGQDISCKVHVGDYHDFSKSESCMQFAKEMIAQPIGNETIDKEDPRADRLRRVAKSTRRGPSIVEESNV